MTAGDLPAEKLSTNVRNLTDTTRQIIAARGWTAFEGEGIGDNGTWPPEPSYLVLGICRPDAIALGHRFEQAAIVAGDAGGTAELILCNPPQPDESASST